MFNSWPKVKRSGYYYRRVKKEQDEILQNARRIADRLNAEDRRRRMLLRPAQTAPRPAQIVPARPPLIFNISLSHPAMSAWSSSNSLSLPKIAYRFQLLTNCFQPTGTLPSRTALLPLKGFWFHLTVNAAINKRGSWQYGGNFFHFAPFLLHGFILLIFFSKLYLSSVRNSLS